MLVLLAANVPGFLAEHYQSECDFVWMKAKNNTRNFTTPFAELVCSNSLKSKSRLNPAGTLKDELTKLGSLIVPTARKVEVPAGETL